jgi:phage-related protein
MAADGQQDGVLDALREIQQTQQRLLSSVESLTSKFSSSTISTEALDPASKLPVTNLGSESSQDAKSKDAGELAAIQSSFENATAQPSSALSPSTKTGFTSRIVLTCVPSSLAAW